MPDEAKKEATDPKAEGKSEANPAAAGRKKGLLLGGGALALVVTAGLGAFLAVPGQTKTPSFNGPFVMSLAEEGTQLQANLAGEGARRYLVMDLRVEYDAYEEAYGLARITDHLYIAKLQDTLLTISAQKSADEVLERGTQQVFLEELVTAIEPLLFPVHLGSAVAPTDGDKESGLRPGLGQFQSTMRDAFHLNKIHIDEPKKTLRLGDGEEFTFTGNEDNLALADPRGRRVYVDVTNLKAGFVGAIGVGVKGRVRNLYKVKFIIQ
jgi:hypothetical protein